MTQEEKRNCSQSVEGSREMGSWGWGDTDLYEGRDWQENECVPGVFL